MAKEKMQVIRVKDYGDDWINRLAVVLDQLQKMGQTERDATMDYIIAKYSTVHR